MYEQALIEHHVETINAPPLLLCVLLCCSAKEGSGKITPMPKCPATDGPERSTSRIWRFPYLHFLGSRLLHLVSVRGGKGAEGRGATLQWVMKRGWGGRWPDWRLIVSFRFSAAHFAQLHCDSIDRSVFPSVSLSVTQSVSQYMKMKSGRANKISIWVNCKRRMWKLARNENSVCVLIKKMREESFSYLHYIQVNF